jgi:hypothetical protein
MIIIYCTLWFNQKTSNGFFTTIFIFAASLVYDYGLLWAEGTRRKDKYQKAISSIGCIFSIIYLLISILGFINFITLNTQRNTIDNGGIVRIHFALSLDFLIIVLIIIPIIAGLELFGGFKRPNSRGHIKKLQQVV